MWEFVQDILKVGFAGITFLLAFLAYRLLAKESDKEAPRQEMLNEISKFRNFALMAAVITVSAQAFEVYQRSNLPEDLDVRLSNLGERLEDIESQAADLETRPALTSLEQQIENLNARIDGIRLTSKALPQSPDYGCAGTQRAEATSLAVMYGLRDGTSCGVTNINYYKEIGLEVPE